MANNINWGRIYCSTEWGDVYNTTDSIPQLTADFCWAQNVLGFSVDDTSIRVDSTNIRADATQL
jgi:hypothetical protein